MTDSETWSTIQGDEEKPIRRRKKRFTENCSGTKTGSTRDYGRITINNDDLERSYKKSNIIKYRSCKPKRAS